MKPFSDAERQPIPYMKYFGKSHAPAIVVNMLRGNFIFYQSLLGHVLISIHTALTSYTDKIISKPYQTGKYQNEN